MADLHTGNDSTVQTKSVDQPTTSGFEASSQALSKPGESQPQGPSSAEKTDKLVSTGVLPDAIILDDADRPASGKNSMKSQDVQKAADGIVDTIKNTHDLDTFNHSVADGINNAIKGGASLTELVQDINKDMQDPNPDHPKIQHASFKTSGDREFVDIKPGPFGGSNFEIKNGLVEVGQHHM